MVTGTARADLAAQMLLSLDEGLKVALVPVFPSVSLRENVRVRALAESSVDARVSTRLRGYICIMYLSDVLFLFGCSPAALQHRLFYDTDRARARYDDAPATAKEC